MTVRSAVSLTLVLLLVPPALGADVGALRDDAFNSSAVCGECHAEIFATWRRSVHSGSMTDPIFEAAYARAYMETGGRARELCLRCHAPIAFATDDLELENPVSREGVSCDYCHSISGVDLSRTDRPYEVRPDGVKRGPLGDAESPAHEVAQSDLHRQAELCAGCHEYATADGLLIFSTYSEWKVSPQAKEGITCQNCHMPITPGSTVIPELGVDRRGINLHNISGGHSSEQVRKAASLRVVSVFRKKPTLAEVQVEVGNVGSGHYLPTGMPTRRLVLEVDLFAGRDKVKAFERMYQRILLDERNKPIDEDHRVVLDAVKLLSDNRLRPGERRLEKFVAVVPEKGDLRAEATLRYLYEPMVLSRTRMSIVMASDESRP